MLFLLSLSSKAGSLASEEQHQNGSDKFKMDMIRGSPTDSCQNSIQIKGHANVVIINGKLMVTSPDSTQKQNNIRVNGEGNTIRIVQNDKQLNSVSVIQNDKKSKVSITQNGNNNRIIISKNNRYYK